jgi:uncharacterized glyoxalase superfamily metalloenzyme YdcJ
MSTYAQRLIVNARWHYDATTCKGRQDVYEIGATQDSFTQLVSIFAADNYHHLVNRQMTADVLHAQMQKIQVMIS